MNQRKDAVKKYFYDGYSYLEIIKFLSKYHDIFISLRQLYRILGNLGLFRRKQHSNVNWILLVVRYLLKDSSSSWGYGSMYQKLRHLGYITNKEKVRLCLKILRNLWHCYNVREYKGGSTFLPVQVTCGTSTDMINWSHIGLLFMYRPLQ